MEQKHLSGRYAVADGSWIRWQSGVVRRFCRPELLEVCDAEAYVCEQTLFNMPDGSRMKVSFPLRGGNTAQSKKDVCICLQSEGQEEMWQDAWLRPENEMKYEFVQAFYADSGGKWITEVRMSGKQGKLCARYSMRENGLIELYSNFKGGTVVTESVLCTGRVLRLNYSTSAAGGIRLGILHGTDGTPICGYAAEDCDLIYGNALSETVTFRGALLPKEMVGQKVYLKFKMWDASLFSFGFYNS